MNNIGRPIRILPNPGPSASKKARPNPPHKHVASPSSRPPANSGIASKEQGTSYSLPPPKSASSVSELPWALERVHFMNNKTIEFPHGFMGSGGFGSVSLVRHKHQGTLAALKVVRLAKGESEPLAREIAALQRIRTRPNRFVVRQPPGISEVMWTSDHGCLYLIFDLYVGNLLHYCGQLQVRDERFLGLVITELHSGLAYLHGMGFIHKDIKPENILIDRDGHCVIADLGGCDLHPGITPDSCLVRPTAGVVTFAYSAPELNEVNEVGQIVYTQAVDLWSLGATLCSLIAPSLPRTVKSPSGNAEPKYSIQALGLDTDSICKTLGDHGCPPNVTQAITMLCHSDFRERLRLQGLNHLIHRYGWNIPLGHYTPFPIDRSKTEVVMAGMPRLPNERAVGADADAAEALLEFNKALGFALPRLGRLPGLGPL